MQSWDMYLEYIETRLNSISLDNIVDILYELTSDEYTIN